MSDDNINDDEMSEDDKSATYYRQLIERGYLNVIGYGDNGGIMTIMTQKMWDEFPNAAKMLSIKENDIFNSLWFKGYLNVSADYEGNFDISIDPDIIERDFENLDFYELNTLNTLVNYLILEGRGEINGRDI